MYVICPFCHIINIVFICDLSRIMLNRWGRRANVETEFNLY